MAQSCTERVLELVAGFAGDKADSLTTFLCETTGSVEGVQASLSEMTTNYGDLNNEIVKVGTSLDGWFVLANAYLVFFMQAGFAMLCAGSVRSKNCMNILLKNVLDGCFGAPVYFLFGYGFAYGIGKDGANPFIGNNDFALDWNNSAPRDWNLFLFQWAFAAATATIVSGSVAERCSFQAYIMYSMFLTAFVYPVVCHWVWSPEGWLSAFNTDNLVLDSGMLDFAGSGVVHMTGGFAGLMGAYIMGPRTGRFQSDGTPSQNFQGHSVTLVVLGTFMLWFGWYGFNPGSMAAINGHSVTVARAAVCTTLGAASGGVTALLWNFYRHRHWDLVQACNGLLCGLVSQTAGCAFVDPSIALLCGAVAAIIFDFTCEVFLKFQIDDPLAASPMHGFCGIWGVIAVGLFARKEYVYEYLHGIDNAVIGQVQYGLLFGGGWNLLACQLIGIVSIAAWTTLTIGAIFKIMRVTGFLRVPIDEEIVGLDISHHGGKAYVTSEEQEMMAQKAAQQGMGVAV